MFAGKDFDAEKVLQKPWMAHLSTSDRGDPRDSPIRFIWEDACIWIFGTGEDSYYQ